MIIMQKSPMSCNCVIYSIDVIVVANDEYRGYHQPTSPPKSFMWHIHSICIYIYAWLEAPNGLALAFIRSLRIFLFFVSFSFNSFIICMCTVYSGTFYVLRFGCVVSSSLYLIFLQPFLSKLRRNGVCVDQVDEKKVQLMCIEECDNGSFSKWMLNSNETFK